MKRIFIIAGSPDVDIGFFVKLSEEMKGADGLYAVDSGLELADVFELTVTKIIGDFDSIKPEILEKYSDDLKVSYKPEKDKSDLEIAIDTAIGDFSDEEFEILTVNADGGRWDHFYFNLMLLFKKPNRIRMIADDETIWAMAENHTYKLPGLSGCPFSILPVSECKDVSISGAKYTLKNAVLSPFTTLTLSNRAESDLKISFKSGKLLLYVGETIL